MTTAAGKASPGWDRTTGPGCRPRSRSSRTCSPPRGSRHGNGPSGSMTSAAGLSCRTAGTSPPPRNPNSSPAISSRSSPPWTWPVPDRPPAPLAVPRFRPAGPGDAAGLLALKKDLDRETSFMLLEPGERSEDNADVAAYLSSMAGTANSVVIVAEAAGRLVGYAEARGGAFRRNRITAHVVIGVLVAAGGRGIGSGLLRELALWAPAHGIRRLELTVMAHNHRARRLYERMGFSVEGRRRECLLVHSQLVDELYMAKLLPPSA